MSKKIISSSAVVLVLSFAFASGETFAAGYSTNLYSASGLGNSYAGSVTGVHDASDLFFNPAISSNLKGAQFVASASYLKVKSDPDNVKSNLATSGNEVTNAGVNALVPAFYLSTPLNKSTSLGLAVTSPFGLATKYDNNWVGRYRAIESSISTHNINPSISHKLSENLSVGFGVQAQYMYALLTKAIYTGAKDAFAKTTASDWGYGYNLGANYKLNDRLKFGLGYRSKMDFKLTGRTRIQDDSGNTGLSGTYQSLARTSTPESLTIGGAFKATDKVELISDFTWTRWSRLKGLVVSSSRGGTSFNDTTTFNWKDSLFYAVGANFTTSDKMTIRTGLAYEKDAVTNSNREPGIPTGDRIWASLGASYKVNNSLSFDASYVHQFFKTTRVNLSNIGSSNENVSARYKTKVDVFSIALKKDF